AIATVLSAFLNCSMLSFGLQKRIGAFPLWRGNGRIAISAISAAVTAFLVDHALLHSRDFLSQISRFMCTAGTFMGVLVLLAYVLKVKEFFSLLNRWVQRE